MVGPIDRNDGCKGGEREMNARETNVKDEWHSRVVKNHNLRNQVGLELVQINIERAIKTEGSRDRRNDLRDESVEVGKAGRRDAQVLLADFVNSLVIDLNHVDYVW